MLLRHAAKDKRNATDQKVKYLVFDGARIPEMVTRDQSVVIVGQYARVQVFQWLAVRPFAAPVRLF